MEKAYEKLYLVCPFCCNGPKYEDDSSCCGEYGHLEQAYLIDGDMVLESELPKQVKSE